MLLLKIEQEMTSGRSFEVGQNIRLRSINSQLPLRPTASLRPVAMIAEKWREFSTVKSSFRLEKNELRSFSTAQERLVFVFESTNFDRPQVWRVNSSFLAGDFDGCTTIRRAMKRPLQRCVYRCGRGSCWVIVIWRQELIFSQLYAFCGW